MERDSANKFKEHVQLYVRTVFADRLLQEGFTSYRGEDIFGTAWSITKPCILFAYLQEIGGTPLCWI